MPIYKMEGKRDGKQKYRVRVNYTDRTGKARQTERVVYGKEEAKELERKLYRDLSEEQICKMTLKELYDEYIAVKKYEVRENSMRAITDRLELYVLPMLGGYTLDKLKAPILQEWKQYIEEWTKANNPSEKMSFKMKKSIFADFCTLLNYAVKMEYLPKNPLRSIGNFKNPYEIKREMRYYTAEEFLRFISAARKQAEEGEMNEKNISNWDFYVFFSIAFYTGMRKGEIYALKWSDIEGDILHVRRSIIQKLKGADRETPPKNKSSVRDLQIPAPLKKILDEHKLRYEKIDGFTEDYRICGGLRCLRDSTLRHRNEKYSAEAGLKTIRIHDFRHSHASLLANHGINIQEIARRLGHTNIEITWNIYSHLYPHEEEKAVEVLNKIV